MQLDAKTHRPIATTLSFDAVTVETTRGERLTGKLDLEFRSFLPGEPLLSLHAVTLHITEGGRCFEVPGHTSDRYILKQPAASSEATLQPFSAVYQAGLTLTGESLSLTPMPAIELDTAPPRADLPNLCLWGSGFAFDDPLLSFEWLLTSGGTTKLLAYEIEHFGREGRFLVIPGQMAMIEQSEGLLGDAGQSAHDWVEFPDHCVTACVDGPVDLDRVRGLYSALRSLLSVTTGHDFGMTSAFYPHRQGYRRRYSGMPVRTERRETVWELIPFRACGVSLIDVLERCWPRVRLLHAHGVPTYALSGWLERGKDTHPVTQGFLNLFVYLECLKHHWQVVRYGESPSSGFEGMVNRTLKDLTGHKRRINGLVKVRDRIVHEGQTGLPINERFSAFAELFNLCASSYLALIGWSGNWLKMLDRGLEPQPAWWHIPDLSSLVGRDEK